MPDTSHSAATTIAHWRAAAESADADAALACLSPEIVLNSPLTDQFRLEGTDQLRDFLTAAFTAVKGIRFHTQTGQGNSYALAYRARVGSQQFEEAQLLLLDDEARIREIALFGRPLPALTALMITLGPDLARRQGPPRPRDTPARQRHTSARDGHLRRPYRRPPNPTQSQADLMTPSASRRRPLATRPGRLAPGPLGPGPLRYPMPGWGLFRCSGGSVNTTV